MSVLEMLVYPPMTKPYCSAYLDTKAPARKCSTFGLGTREEKRRESGLSSLGSVAGLV